MADLAFELEYDGPALQAHEMAVRDLAPALVSVADLFQELNRQLYPVAAPLSVNVRATAEGSFLVQLKLLYDSAVSTLAGDEVTAVANLTALLGTAGGVIIYVRHRFRSEPVTEEPVPDEPGLARITFQDGTIVEIPESVLRVRENISVQRSLAEVVRPVTQPGVDVVRFRRENVTIAEVPKADAAAFAAPSGPSQRDVLHSGERDAFLAIHTAGFQTNHWRFYDGQSLIWATIQDEDFIGQLDNGTLRVGPQDVLNCRIREEQWRDPSGFHAEVDVLQVLQVLPFDPGTQGTFELGEGPDGPTQ